ncbi:MAG: SDR family oxidoreductase [Paludibacteraceae bacterium]|nr:SDR family oxidoreductase [Prevotellaceae bacterium]
MKVAVITGGTKGIGKQIAIDLLNRNFFVYTNYANDDLSAKEAEKNFKCISNNFRIIKADQTSKTSFQSFIQQIKDNETEINCIVANSGATIRKPSMQITDEEWENVMQITVNTHFYLIRDLHSLIANDSRIIFIGSMMGILPHSTSLAYGVSKAALHALAKNLVKEFENTGTTVNAIAPGFVETEWQKSKPKEIRQNIYKKTALGRFADVKEVSSAVMFCIDNSFVNGSIIETSGGYCYK